MPQVLPSRGSQNVASAGNLLEVQVLMLHLNQKSKDQGQLVLMSLLQDSSACSSLRSSDLAPLLWRRKWGSETLRLRQGHGCKWPVRFHAVRF